jgi:hypothetical protein
MCPLFLRPEDGSWESRDPNTPVGQPDADDGIEEFEWAGTSHP